MKSAAHKLGFNIVILIFFFSSTIMAQTVKIRVVDDKQIPLEGAMVKSLHQVFTTNRDGEFEYKIVPNDSLQIRYLGFKEKLQVISRHFLTEPIIQLEAMPFDLNQVNVVHTNKSTSVISNIDLKVKPVSSSQEILRSVPGLFIGQHAGGGKAEQLFLRGFDIDHGTDVSVNFEGMPVNMTSHAHGQGYADLHFIIPEVVENINFGKGPYYADKGNFTTAAYVDFKVKDIFDRSGITLEAGQYNSLRGAAFFNLINTPKTKSYIASEYNLSDGWFDSPQDFNRFNLMGRVQHDLNKKNKLSLLVSQFSSKWNASGQVPNRAIESGLISRFGSIDNTEGGNTARQNLIIKLDSKLGEGKFFSQNAYFSRYDFNLFSNFTFFLNDPLNGDQIKQKERRTVSGYQASFNRKKYYDNISVEWKAGAGFRNDNIIENQLAHTKSRIEVLQNYRLGGIDETNVFSFGEMDIDLGKLLINPGIRIDAFRFRYQDRLTANNFKNQKTHFSPKLNLVYQASNALQYYLKTGIGFHSNDARVVLESDANKTLPSATGMDLGVIVKPWANVVINSSVWLLDLEQEFVYVGDEGIIEPSGKTRRVGADFSLRYQPFNWLFLNLDYNHSIGRNKGQKENKYIPLAPLAASVGSLTIKQKSWNASLSTRYLSDRPANEDYTLKAKGYTVTDLSMSYSYRNFRVHSRIENVLNVQWNETQFATLTRLKNEINPVEEIHFTPGTPFFFKAGITYSF